MNINQIIEVGKALLPYLREDLTAAELGQAAHDAMAALNRANAKPTERGMIADCETEQQHVLLTRCRLLGSCGFADLKCICTVSPLPSANRNDVETKGERQ